MLGKVRIANGRVSETTAVSNIFIDSYLADANDAQIKIYLYLLRIMQAGRATTVSEIADMFNHTEREVTRALSYWEDRGLVRLEYDGKNLVNINIEDLSGEGALSDRHTGSAAAKEELPAAEETESDGASLVPARRRYSAGEISGFCNDEALAMTLFAAEQYFKRALNPSETQVILYIYEELAFPADLLDYLLQYTAEHTKGRYASYLEKTAIGWHAEGIRTLADAKERGGRGNRQIYEIMRALGLSANRPSPFETGYFNRWLGEYGFPMETILAACKKTVFRVQSHRVEYTDGILSDWHAKGAHTLKEVTALESSRVKQTPRKSARDTSPRAPEAPDTRNRFNHFHAQEYDFAALKNIIVSNN